MDNETIMNIMMASDKRRELIRRMSASIISASAVFGKSQDEILNFMNIMIKDELEKNKKSAEILERSVKKLKDMYGIDEDKI